MSVYNPSLPPYPYDFYLDSCSKQSGMGGGLSQPPHPHIQPFIENNLEINSNMKNAKNTPPVHKIPPPAPGKKSLTEKCWSVSDSIEWLIKGQAFWRSWARRGAESSDGKKAWPSINHLIFSGLKINIE
jgi:hypothetical protein